MRITKNESAVTRRRPDAGRLWKLGAMGLLLALIALAATATFANGASSAQPQVNLRTADSYAVLAAATITNTGPTRITGDLGLHSGTSVTGAPTVIGNTHVADAAALQAQTDLGLAYVDAAGRGPTTPSGADLGGKNLGPGVYNSASSIGLTGTVTLDGGGDANAVFIFQAGSTLTTEVNSRVVLANGAQACNVYWVVGSDTTLKTGSLFNGTILGYNDVTLNTNVVVNGRVLAGAQASPSAGALTLDSDTITRTPCAAAAPTPAATTTAATTTAATTTTAPTTTAPKPATTTAAKPVAKPAAKPVAKPKPAPKAKPATKTKTAPTGKKGTTVKQATPPTPKPPTAASGSSGFTG